MTRPRLPKARATALGAAFTVLLTLLLPASPSVAAPSDAALAARWAPVHYQDTAAADYDADYLSTVDFDGDWDTKNNWEHQDDVLSRLTGAVYYSVVETTTHWFIGYSFYHARDWSDVADPFGLWTHENDMEGLVMVVRRAGGEYGSLEAMVTVAHDNFYSYTPAGSPLTGGRENIDGPVIMRTVDGVSRPTTAQEAKGHGVYAWNGGAFPGGDGVVYYPAAAGEVPSSGVDNSVAYRLVDTFAPGGLWAHRNDALTFASWSAFRGDNGKDNAAKAVWGWDDNNDGADLPRGLLATDPAKLVGAYFDNEGAFALSYTRNGFV